MAGSCIVWCNFHRPDCVIVGYDNCLEKANTGDLIIFDAVAGKVASTVVPGASRQLDIWHGAQSAFFATASVSTRPRNSVQTHVRLYSLNPPNTRTRAQTEFDSAQRDINVVTTSPCEWYVTGSGTGGITEVWDRRNPDRVLHVLCHEEPVVALIPGGNREDDDTGVQCALWGPTNDRLYTGSSDGKMKVWDIKRGDPFIRDSCSLSSQVMSGAFSPDYSMLMIGECSGQATLLSETEQGQFSVISQVASNDIPEEEGESAAEAAKQLVRSGKIMIRDGVAWATGIDES